MDGPDPIRVVQGKVATDAAAEVTVGCAELLVADDRHQLGPQPRDLDAVACRSARVTRISVPRHVGDHHVESVGRVPAVRSRVGKQRNDFGVAPEGVGPTVAQDERQCRSFARRPGMHEMNVRMTELDLEVRECIERRLLRRPVELLDPVIDQFAEITEVGAQRPPGVHRRIRPPRRPQAGPQILQRPGFRLQHERSRAGCLFRHGQSR